DSQIPWLIACLAVGIGINLLVRDVLLTDLPQKLFPRLLRSLQAQAGIVVIALHAAVSAEAVDPPSRRRLGRRLDALGVAAGMVEEKIEEASVRVLPPISNSELTLRIFDFELAVERLAAVLTPVLDGQRELTPSTRARVGAELRWLGHLLQHLPPPPEPAVTEADTVEIDSELSDYERRVFTALHHLDEACSNVTSPHAEDGNLLEEAESTASDTESAAAASGEAAVPGSWLDPTRRQAIQVGVATSLAAIAGELISPARWYWAVITAFVIFTGTRSRGEILTKGWQRLLGAFGGAVLGSLLASLLHGNVIATGIVMLTLLFIGVYLMRLSPGFLVFCITGMLALLYHLLGRSVVELLELRVAETAVGAVIGIAVAFAVLPQSTRDLVSANVTAFLDQLGGLMTTAVRRLTGAAVASETPLLESRAVRAAFRAVRSSSRPLTHGWLGVATRSGFRFTLRALSACDHYGHRLAWLADRWPGGITDTELRAQCESAVAEVTANIAVLSDWFRHGDSGVIRVAASLDLVEDAAARVSPQQRRHALSALRFMRRIDGAITAFADRVGLPNESAFQPADDATAAQSPTAPEGPKPAKRVSNTSRHRID
ncbi:MAG TPA: FUSC family protein, partial [Mycobacteriales bacterium]|nr:FUSC family protein [Mycobacteriales bacterium]